MIVHPYKIQVGTYLQIFHLKYVYIIGMGGLDRVMVDRVSRPHGQKILKTCR